MTLVQVVDTVTSPASAGNLELPLLSFPKPTVFSVAACLARAQNVSAVKPLRSRGGLPTKTPPA